MKSTAVICYSSAQASAELQGLIERLTGLIGGQAEVFNLRTMPAERLASCGIILPLLIQKGQLWKRLEAAGRPVSAPLLSSRQDCLFLASAVNRKCSEKSGRSWLLAAHGSEREEDNAQLVFLDSLLRKDIMLRTLKADLSDIDAKEVTVLPLLLTAGRHLDADIRKGIIPQLEERGITAYLHSQSFLSMFESETAQLYYEHFLKAAGS